MYRSDFRLLWVGKALVSQGVREVLLQKWILDCASGRGNSSFPLPINY